MKLVNRQLIVSLISLLSYVFVFPRSFIVITLILQQQVILYRHRLLLLFFLLASYHFMLVPHISKSFLFSSFRFLLNFLPTKSSDAFVFFLLFCLVLLTAVCRPTVIDFLLFFTMFVLFGFVLFISNVGLFVARFHILLSDDAIWML